jgi:hypothetical protein
MPPTGILTPEPSVRAGEESSCLRLRGHWGRPRLNYIAGNFKEIQLQAYVTSRRNVTKSVFTRKIQRLYMKKFLRKIRLAGPFS